jgi:hypothetical protein
LTQEPKPLLHETDLDARVSLAIFPASLVPPAAHRQEKIPMVPSSTSSSLSPWLIHGSRLFLASSAILALVTTGCQTPQTNPYAATVAPPATGMAGQPAPYGYNAAVPQGAGYPSAAPMPGPTMPAPTTMGQVPPTATTPPPALPPGMQPPAAPAGQQPASSWSWAQTSNAPPQQQWQAGAQPPPTMTQQGQQLAAPYQQQVAAQAQQYSAQAQQATNNTINGYQNQLNTQWQQANQQAQNGLQPPMTGQPVVQQSQYPPQTSTNAWWPFSDPNQFPPARATPASPANY